MIQDRIVIGILDKTLSERQIKNDLTLANVVSFVRNSEMVRKQQQTLLEVGETPLKIEAINKKRIVQRTRTYEQASSNNECGWCEFQRHDRNQCQRCFM